LPPGRRTFLILRPRALAWDLLLLAGPGRTDFRELSREEAAAGAEAVYRALQEWAAGGPGSVEPAEHPEGGFLVRATVGGLPFLACLRDPGQPYRPLICPDADAARRAAGALASVLCPAPGAEQEVYFNSRHFSR
jgi:hypothetical protein